MVKLDNEGGDTAQLVQRSQPVIDFYRLFYLTVAPANPIPARIGKQPKLKPGFVKDRFGLTLPTLPQGTGENRAIEPS